MKTISARTAKEHFGELLDSAQHAPVVIQRHGRNVAVILSMQEYGILDAIENDLCAALVRQVEEDGMEFLGVEESQKLLDEVMSRGKKTNSVKERGKVSAKAQRSPRGANSAKDRGAAAWRSP